MLRCVMLLSFCLASLGTDAIVHAQTAVLHGKFILKGTPPQPQPIVDVKVDFDFPGQSFVDESLVVDPQSKGIANIAVYVVTPNVPITAEAKRAVAPQRAVEARDGQFRPRVSGLWIGEQELALSNNLETATNFNFPFANHNPLLAPGVKEYEISVTERNAIPQPIRSDIYPWMKGYLLPRDNPYFAVTASDGSFQLPGLPTAVPLEIQVWHEKAGFLAADPKWQHGRFQLMLAADTDLGTVEVPVEEFRK